MGTVIAWHTVVFQPPYYADFGFAGCESQYDPEPGYIIMGKSSSVGDDYDIFLEKIDTNMGSRVWLTWFGSADEDEGTSIKEVSDGYVLTGLYTTRAWLVKRDFNGAPVWSTFLSSQDIHFAEGFDLEVTGDKGFIVCGGIRVTAETNSDIYIVKTDANGNIQWSKIIDYSRSDGGYSIEEIGPNTYAAVGITFSDTNSLDGFLLKLGPMLNDTDDRLSLAYNGNRHLARKPNTEELHLVYTRMDSVIYQYSGNGGDEWTPPASIGMGKFPTITLGSNGLASVAWTDSIGGLWYRRQTAPGIWSEVYHLYDPWNIWDPKLNAPPSIVITPHSTGDSVHILCTMHNPANGPINSVRVYSFRIDLPMAGLFTEIEGGAGQFAGAIRSNPSIARCAIDNSIHAVWQRADTICYATRHIGQPWDNWGWQFSNAGLQSAHPFVETYGDMVYVVWQHKEPPGAPEEVYKGRKQLSDLNFYWERFSQTPNTASRYPVNASGLFTVFVDSPEPPINGPEIYYKVRPDDPLYNISQTIAGSYYPQSVARLTDPRTYLYTAWLDGDQAPYEIRFKKIPYIPVTLPPYLTSLNGYETPSPYLVARDSFIADWQVPVDVGYQTITYRFPLELGYRYKIKVIGYHESAGQWREWVKIDNKLKHLIKYNAYAAETLEFWIPPAFYQDGVIDVVFDRVSGAFATAGPIYIYQYEYEEAEELASGPMAQASSAFNNADFTIVPNPFKGGTQIRYGKKGNQAFLKLKIYDITGRLVRNLYEGRVDREVLMNWYGDDADGRIVPPGIYFLICENGDTKETSSHKIIKLR